jgi:hypothetical protein
MKNDNIWRFTEGYRPSDVHRYPRIVSNDDPSGYEQRGHQPASTVKPSDVKPPRSGSSVTPGKQS